jgi:hypothetical protein
VFGSRRGTRRFQFVSFRFYLLKLPSSYRFSKSKFDLGSDSSATLFEHCNALCQPADFFPELCVVSS